MEADIRAKKPRQAREDTEVRILNPYPNINAIPCETTTTTSSTGKVHPILLKIITAKSIKSPPAGRTKLFLENWRKLTRDQNILGTVMGWKIPFVRKPFQKNPPKQYSMGKTTSKIVSKEIASMLGKGAIKVVPDCKNQFISNIFVREKKDGGHRPIINLKQLNAFIPYAKFKMETLKNVKGVIKQNDFMVKIDLKDAYFSLPINRNYRKYTRFRWEGTLYEFLCLTFGIGPAPRIFTKVLKVPISLLRKLNIRIVIYIDDLLVFGATLEEVEQARDSVIYLLKNLGFVINYKKSILTPTQIIEFLGVLIDSLKMTMSIPLKKANKLKALCQHTLMVKTITVKELSSVIGKLNATSPAFTHAQLQIRYLQRALIKAETTTYKDKVYLNKKARLELKWWLKNIHLMNGKPITINPPDMTIASDAAKTGGWGAECHGKETGGPWN